MLTFGSDPEFFIPYDKNGESYVEPPAYFREVLGVPFTIPDGRKDLEPYRQHPVFADKDGIQIIEDGVAFEYTLKPTTEAKFLVAQINQAHEMLVDLVGRYGYTDVYKKPVIKFDCFGKYNPDLIPDEYFSCMIFGCDRDFDAIDFNYQGATLNVREHDKRYGGGHLHVGSEDKSVIKLLHDNYRNFIRMLAIFVGNTCIAESDYPELEKIRSFHYGNPGRYRLPEHGVEYRTPSNSWTSNLSTAEKIFERTKKAFNIILERREDNYIEEYLEPTIRAIKDADQNLSNQILSAIGV